MRNPPTLISVILPVYNGEKFLRNALESIEIQKYPALEIIVVDDGSTDSTPAIIKSLGEEVVSIRQENQGPGIARNVGIQAATAPILAFLDADDLWTPGRLFPMIKILDENPEVDIVRGQMQIVYFDGKHDVPNFYPFLIGSALYRREVFEKIGGYDPQLRFGEDVDWFVRARESGLNMQEYEEVVLLYKRHPGNMTRKKTLGELGLMKVIKKKLNRARENKTPPDSGAQNHVDSQES